MPHTTTTPADNVIPIRPTTQPPTQQPKPKSPKWRWIEKIQGKDGPPNPNTRWVLVCLGLHADNDGGSCFPGVDRLVEKTGLSKSTVQRAIKWAVGAGWLVQTMPNADHKSCQYRLLMSPADTVENSVGGCHPDTGGVSQGPGGGVTLTPYIPTTTQLKEWKGINPSHFVEIFAGEAQKILGGGRKSEATNRIWLESNLSRVSPETIHRAIYGLRLAIDAGAVWKIEPGDTASLKALDRKTDGGTRKVLAVALEYAERVYPQTPQPDSQDGQHLVTNTVSMVAGPTEPANRTDRIAVEWAKLTALLDTENESQERLAG